MSTAEDASRTRHVPALDGLRGIAVLVIMVYHGGVLFTAGGFYGVDMFFTLSGFLITSLLIVEWRRSGTINRRDFYARRARRLLPALFLMIVGVAIYARYLVPRGTYPGLRGDALSALGFVANWRFLASSASYFNRAAAASPLLHTWSLGVEEQFYVIWPLVMFVVLRRTKSLRALLLVSLGLTVASAIEMAILYTPANPDRVFYGTDTRAQALMVGCSLACALAMHKDNPLTARTRAALTGLGVAGLTASVILWAAVNANDAFAYRGGFLLVGLACAGIVANVVIDPRALTAKVLSFPPLRYVGRISYGLYLWHFPLFAYLDASRVGDTRWPLFGVRAAATLAIATASFYLVEQPVRRGALRNRRRGWLAAPAALAATVAALLIGTTVPAVAKPTPHVAASALYLGPPVRVLILGDSVALTLGLGMDTIASRYDVDPSDKGLLGCGLIEALVVDQHGVRIPVNADCDPRLGAGQPQRPELWQHWIHGFRPNVVMILAGRWEVTNEFRGGAWTNILHPAFARYVNHQLVNADALAASTGAHVVLLTAPCYSSGEQPNGEPWPEDSAERLGIYNNLVRQVAAAHQQTTSLLDVNALVCPGGKYRASIGNTPLRDSDGVHFTSAGAALLGEQIWPTIVRLGRAQMASRSSP